MATLLPPARLTAVDGSADAAAPRWPLLVVVGPTASGKTALALALAEAFGGEIVGVDAMQLYRGFCLGAAQPTAAELRRLPHHLIGEVDPRQPLTAGEYGRRARSRIRAMVARGHLPVLAGGTGLYLRAVLEGLFAGPPRQEGIRARLRARAALRGPESLHRLLRRLDPAAAKMIAPRDAARAIRALEVRLATGRRISELWNERPPRALAGARPLLLGLDPPRPALYERINRRAEAMFASPGIVEETRGLLATYGAGGAPGNVLPAAFASHGYKQAVDILWRGRDPAAALAEAQRDQRRYAKRQMTWFRRDARIAWLQGFGDDRALERQAREWVARWLAEAVT